VTGEERKKKEKEKERERTSDDRAGM